MSEAKDPRRVLESKDMEGAVLYAKRISSDAADAWPVLANADGSLIINITSGTVSLSSTKVTIESASGLNVNVATATLGTVTISGNVNVATATLGTVTVSLSSTAVTASLTNSGVTVSLNRSLSSSSGTLSATTGTVLIAGSGKSKVYGFSLTTTSTTGVICSFHAGGIAGTELWRVLLQAPSGANAGANLAISPPAHLFATASNGTLTLNLSAAVRVDFSVAYFDEA